MNYDGIAQRAGDAPFNAQQKWTELAPLLKLLDNVKPKNVLEIGVYKGGTIMAWTFVSDLSARIIGVDLPGGEFGGGFDANESHAIKRLALHDQVIELMAIDSHAKSTIMRLKKLAPFDFIFVDADHTYEGVKQDFDNYFPMLADGGIMAFHDIVKPNPKNHPDVMVHKWWTEVKDIYSTIEYIDMDFPSDWNPWGGIGVIVK